MADWYYIGHFGQLGPLTKDQIDDLILGGVIARDTYVWKAGMPNWVQAGDAVELAAAFSGLGYSSPPPPPPVPGPTATMSAPPAPDPFGSRPYGSETYATPSTFAGPSMAGGYPLAQGYSTLPAIKSDRSRIAGGVLNMILPGVGRMYLGYSAIGVLQFFVTLITCGMGWLWPLVDGILMLTGVLKVDGYGRRLED